MGRIVSIGAQGFDDLRNKNCFYIDKTAFIKKWWESEDVVTLITRPRRFGKTLNMNMLECFFSNKYAGRSDLFEGLEVWKDEKYRELQGTWPVISMSFASIKMATFSDTREQINMELYNVFQRYRFLLEDGILSESDRAEFLSVNRNMDLPVAVNAINTLCRWLSDYYGKNVIVLLDEYDTPMQEAWINGYWDEMVSFIRSMFNATLKTNSYLERAMLTGITRVSKESIFSDLNNLIVVTTTSDRYADCFGFTEKEVFASLDEMDLSEMKAVVKKWYDGFTFGKESGIYNPWSITNFLKEKKLGAYWASTSSNALINRVIREGEPQIKQTMEDLLAGKTLTCEIDEQIVFNQLDETPEAIWSLLLTSGYLKVVTAPDMTKDDEATKCIYELALTNKEVQLMFKSFIRKWFVKCNREYNEFTKALLAGDLKGMNRFMNKVALATISYFDSGSCPSEKAEPERFYHGFVLGMIVDLEGRYTILSNRESGYGRYDIMMEPLNNEDPAFILEFKVFDSYDEATLEDTAAAALKQIEEKQYEAQLKRMGIAPERIRKYGFAFEGKTVLIK